MVNNSSNINKANTHLSLSLVKRNEECVHKVECVQKWRMCPEIKSMSRNGECVYKWRVCPEMTNVFKI